MKTTAFVVGSLVLVMTSSGCQSPGTSRTSSPAVSRHLRKVELTDALARADSWASVVIVVDPAATSLSGDVRALNEGAEPLVGTGSTDLGAAITVSRRAAALGPSVKDYNWLGVAVPVGGRVSNQFLAVKSVPAAALSNLAVALKLRGDAQAAENTLQRAIALSPGLAPAHNNLGWLLRSKGKSDAAILSFREAARIDPNYFEARANLGLTLFLKGSFKAAAVEFAKAKELLEAAEKAQRPVDLSAVSTLMSQARQGLLP